MVGFLMIKIGESVYVTFVSGGKVEGINPFIILAVISVVFLISLILNKRKYGD